MEHNPLAEIRSVEKEAQEKIAASQKETADRQSCQEEADLLFAQAAAAAKRSEELVAK